MHASFFIHNTTPWNENTSRWDVRAVQFLLNSNGEIHRDERYPNVALILAEAPVDEMEIEHMFRLSPEEDFSVFIISDVPADYPHNMLFDDLARIKNIKAVA